MRDRSVRVTSVRGLRTAFAVACCLVSAPVLVAQSPPTLSEGLMRQWDLNHDGKIDASEAERARAHMRRARNEAMMKDATDPITGRPRSDGNAAPARGQMQGPGAAGRTSAPEDDGGLILVPGTGEPPPLAGRAAAEPMPATPRRDRDVLPGTRVPTPASTTPSIVPPIVTPGTMRGGSPQPTMPGSRGVPGSDLSSRARILPDGSVAPPPVTNRQPAPPRPGIIAGGARATSPAGRPGTVGGGTSRDLNAGRLPAGLPQARGVSPGGFPVPATQPGASAAARGGTARVPAPTAFPPGAGSAARGMTQAQLPSARSATPATSGLRPPAAQPTLPRSQAPATAVPRPSRVGPDDFYGR